MDYKESLLLPKTSFPMRGNLPNNEPKRYKQWFENNVYQKMKDNRSGNAEMFTLHDGPPYANGHIHIGHALNKILKDIIIKFNYFNGKAVRFTPGWDCHGLPIEQQVEKKLGGKAKKELLSTTKVRELCREHAKKFVNIQKEEFKELGIIADWDKPYLTMDYNFEANIYRTLMAVAKKGLLIERSKPVYWSWAERTALAEAEVEYEDKVSPSIFVAFELSEEAKSKANILEKKASLIIWTTTPWTLPSNTGISLNPNEDYILSEDGYIVAKKLYNSAIELGLIKGKIINTFFAKVLENELAINPLNQKSSRIVLGEHVLMENGTGCVHTAPGHGEDDYRIGLEYNLDVVMPVNEEGKFDQTLKKLNLIPNPDDFIGRNVFKCNDDILELLGDSLVKYTKITHSYPHCWRSHTPLIFRATKQWFISVDATPNGKTQTLRNIASSDIKKTLFYPKTGKNRLNSMVEGRPDWCISRQRDWGVPIAFFRNKKTGEVVLDERVLNYIAMIFEKHGSDAWYSMSISDLLFPASGLNADDLEKVNDILDVWFDSGSTWNAVLKSGNYDAGNYPADTYVEGSDQHRGWFQSSLFLSASVEHKAPYKSVLTHGFTVDEKGEKMSKSKGNVLAPDKVLKQYGSEILRLWVASSDYQSDLKISDSILKQTAEQYRKIRNTSRFLLANISDLERLVDIDKLSIIDKWILNKTKKVFDEVHAFFETYDFVKGMSLLNNYLVNELSGIYMDLCKDRLYCDAKNSDHRMASQTAMAMIFKSYLGLIAPVLTFTSDEILDYAPSIVKGDAKDIFDFIYTPLPSVEVNFDEAMMLEARQKFSEIVDLLKKEKKIKATLELVIYSSSEFISNMDRTEAEDWFLVSKVLRHSEENTLGTFSVGDDIFEVYNADKVKCPRCWKFRSKDENCLCERCTKVTS
jgi:isoleucyl-tRNA synthetase